jgi:hypothetical protein
LKPASPELRAGVAAAAATATAAGVEVSSDIKVSNVMPMCVNSSNRLFATLIKALMNKDRIAAALCCYACPPRQRWSLSLLLVAYTFRCVFSCRILIVLLMQRCRHS